MIDSHCHLDDHNCRGKSAAEMLALLQARLPNDAETELRVAAGEQAKITEIRLGKLSA